MVACGGAGKTVPFTDITSSLHGFAPARTTSVKFPNREKFARFLQKAMPGDAPAVPRIDWAHVQPVLIAPGPRSSTGYALRVVSVRKRDGRLVVTVHERTPSLGEPVIARVTYPYRLITVPKTSLRLLLHYEGRP